MLKLADSLGFRVKREARGECRHPAALDLIDLHEPSGAISRCRCCRCNVVMVFIRVGYVYACQGNIVLCESAISFRFVLARPSIAIYAFIPTPSMVSLYSHYVSL